MSFVTALGVIFVSVTAARYLGKELLVAALELASIWRDHQEEDMKTATKSGIVRLFRSRQDTRLAIVCHMPTLKRYRLYVAETDLETGELGLPVADDGLRNVFPYLDAASQARAFADAVEVASRRVNVKPL